MKHFFSNLLIALICTFFSFCLFKAYYLPQAVASLQTENEAVQLVSNEAATVNQSPRAWSVVEVPNFTAAAGKVTNAVVNITTYSSSDYRQASGSGVIISPDGYIITNKHVIEDGEKYEITLSNKRKLYARLVGRDATTDIALLKINANNLTALPFANSDRVEVGEWVLAIGNPFNLNSTVTAGIISAKARNINILEENYAIESFIQTDAVVNSGNSGGALVNVNGELIGVNTAIMSESGGFEGYSFAIPSNLVRKVASDLRNYGEVKRAILGVRIQDVDEEIAHQLSLPEIAGVYVTSITRGGSAEGAGLSSGDVITRVNGVNIDSTPQLQEQVAIMRPGDRISIEYYRKGRKYRKDNVILKSLKNSVSSY